jgi:hypothetical protein
LPVQTLPLPEQEIAAGRKGTLRARSGEPHVSIAVAEVPIEAVI